MPGGASAAAAPVPTSNPAAYDAYLRGQAAWNAGSNTDPASLRRALTQFQQAVALDSTFVAAWNNVALTTAFLYTNGQPTRELAARAKAALDRLVALDPDGLDTRVTRARYRWFVEFDVPGALAELEAALSRSPNDAALLGTIGTLERASGRWDDALRHAAAAYALDPRSASRASSLSQLYLYQRRPDLARAPGERALALSPLSSANVTRRVMIALSEGDLAAAQRAVAGAAGVPRDELMAGMAVIWDLGWVLTDADQRYTLTLTPTAFDNDQSSWSIVRTQLYGWRGDTAQMRVWADTAARYLAALVREVPHDPQRHVMLGLALAYGGHRTEAIAEVERGLARARATPDGNSDPYYHHLAARAYLLLGDRGKALDELEGMMRVPYFVTRAWLRIDPSFAGLRGDGRFERLVAGA